MNELYTHPEMPVGTEEGIIKGIYQLRGDHGSIMCGISRGSGNPIRNCTCFVNALL
jgi:pyruvate dehydrogenase complex dehydrogenase (E1) component